MNAVQELPPQTFSQYQMGIQLRSALVTKIANTSQDPRVFELRTDMRKKWIPTADFLHSLGYQFKDVQAICPCTMKNYQRIALIRAAGGTNVYYITDRGLKHLIPSLEVFKSYNNSFKDVFVVSPSELNEYKDSVLIRQTGQSKVYLIENNMKRWIASASVFKQREYSFQDITEVNQTEMNYYQEGSPITS